VDILGISAFYHDSVATLLRDGNIVAAAQDDRHFLLRRQVQHPNEPPLATQKSPKLTFADDRRFRSLFIVPVTDDQTVLPNRAQFKAFLQPVRELSVWSAPDPMQKWIQF